jgi:hypothetical protein
MMRPRRALAKGSLMDRLAFVCLLLTASLASAQDCRDDSGEPAACPPASVAAAATPVNVTATITRYDAPATPAPSAPAEPGPSFFEHSRERSVAYGGWELSFDVASLAGLRLTQAGAARAPELARTAALQPGGDVVLAVASMLVGVRPVPWLRVPELRLSVGGGDYEDRAASWSDGAQDADAALGTLFFIRAEVAAGVELPLGELAIFALGHVAIAGYFLDARLDHAVAGDLGAATLAEDAWELGWTAGLAGHVGGGVYFTASYRHVHTGAESNSVRFGVTADLN